MTLRLNELLGSDGDDTVTGASFNALFGLGGNDSFQSAVGATFQAFIGGPGNDTYTAADDSVIIILETGDSSADRVVADGIGLSFDSSFAAEIDGRHLAAWDQDSGQVLVVIDWKDAANRIETAVLADGEYSFDFILSTIFTASGYLGNLTWDQWAEQADTSGFTGSELAEAVEFYINQAAEVLSGDSGGGGGSGTVVNGTMGDDELTGDSGADSLIGGFGDDVLRGGEGDDYLEGGFGNDVLIGGAGVDSMNGGFGDDAYRVDSNQDVVEEESDQGEDTIFSSVSLTLPLNVERLVLTGSDDLTGVGHNGGVTLVGNDGNNTLRGNSASDTLDGGAGDDTLIGDALNDVYFVDSVGDVVVEDDVIGYDSISSTVSYTIPENVERIILVGSDPLSATGSSNADRLIGNAGDNTLLGLDGDDVMEGRDGSDLIQGGVGNDFLFGDDGDDTIIGGTGADFMEGGAGQDTFVFQFSSEFSTDLITDFEAGENGDVLDFSAFFDTVDYAGSTPVADGYLSFEQSGADTIVRIDEDGGGDSFSLSLTLRDVTATDIIDANVLS